MNESQRVVQFKYNSCPIPCCLPLVASEQLLSKQVTGNATFSWVDHGESPEIMSGDALNYVRHGGEAQAISARANGARTKVIGIETYHNSWGIAVRADSSITSVKQLKGRKLAIIHKGTPAANYMIIENPYLLTARCLAANGLNDSDVEWVEAGLPEKVPQTVQETLLALRGESDPACKALLEGKVDAASLGHQRTGQLVGEGKIRMLYDLMDHPENPSMFLTTVREETLLEYPDIVRQFVMVMVRNARWIRAHRGEAIKLLARDCKISEEAIVRSHSSDFHMHIGPEFTEENINALRARKDFMITWGMIEKEKDFDIESWLEPGILDEALIALGD